MHKVVLTDYVWDKLDAETRILSDIAKIVSFKSASVDEFLAEAMDCDALLNTYAGPITADLMAKMPRCKIIARYGIGVDTIDVQAATDLGIIVTNNPTYCVDEVADHTMALILALVRKIAYYDRQVRDGRWNVSDGKPIFPIGGSNLGLVGFGNIARQVAKRAVAFGMKVTFFDPAVEESPLHPGVKKVSFDALLEQADVISLHAPLNAQTHALMNDAAFARMRSTALLINVARGKIVDTDALVRALDQGLVAGAALDTTDPEPLPAVHPLRDRDNVILTPHAAWYSEASMQKLQAGAPSEVRRLFDGTWPINVVNPAVRGHSRAGL